jgi:hypothetical protein
MTRYSATFALAMLAGTVSLAGQTPQLPPPQPQSQAPAERVQQATDVQRPAAAAADQAITITGCLKTEAAVPGLRPNPVERAGITEDFVVTDVKMAPGSAVSGIGVASKYEVEGIDEAELKKHINHQVELTGIIVQPGTAAGGDAPDFKATSMKMLAATCPAAK